MTVLLLAACCVPHAAAAEAAVPSASFVVTQAGMNNAPALYAAFLADAIAEANAKMREPNYWCSVAAGQDGCSGCTCHERNTGVDVAAHMDRIRGARPPELGADITWRDGDFFALAGRPEDGSVQIEILDRDAAGAYVGAVRLTTMIGKIRMHFLDSFFLFLEEEKKRGGESGLGFEIPFDGSAISGGGFFSICCAGFIWFKGCSCESGCHCSHVCSDPPIVGTAITELQVCPSLVYPFRRRP